LRGLFGRINELSESGSTNIPKLVLIADGVYTIETYQSEYGGDLNYVDINVSISIVKRKRNWSIFH